MTNLYIWLTIGLVAIGADLIFINSTYLVMVGLAAFITAIPAFLGFSLLWQLILFAITGFILCFIPWTQQRRRRHSLETAYQIQNMDLGHEVQVNEVNHLGVAKVNYRGAIWDAIADHGYTLSRGVWIIVALKCNQLILKKKA
ncbi:MAG: NfeD family protein [Burkholderiales bacterium]|nr:NfeD family protein [Burkholderiales bacterium]